MRLIGHIFLFFSVWASAQIINPQDLPDVGVIRPDSSQEEDIDYEEAPVDYSRFPGRVTDYDNAEKLVKIKVENNNIKYLRSGDVVEFKINNHDSDFPCRGFVRTIEDFYFVLYVQDLGLCWVSQEHFRRGFMLNMTSNDLKTRLGQATDTRETLLKRKKDFLRQLSSLNDNIWSYKQTKLKISAEYDLKIQQIERQKQTALDNHHNKNRDNIDMREAITKKLDLLDRDLKFYQVERQELLLDRWSTDQDTGLPMAKRPQSLRD